MIEDLYLELLLERYPHHRTWLTVQIYCSFLLKINNPPTKKKVRISQILNRLNKSGGVFRNFTIVHSCDTLTVWDYGFKEFVSDSDVKDMVESNLDKCSKLGF